MKPKVISSLVKWSDSFSTRPLSSTGTRGLEEVRIVRMMFCW